MAILTGVLTASASALTLWKFTHQRRWQFKYVLSYILTTSLLSWYCQKWFGADSVPSISAFAWLLAVHFITLAAVTCGYRVSPFHPLAAFPGPTLYKLSDLVIMYTVSTGYRYLELSALHEQYGDFVRIGPNKLSILSHSIQRQVYKSSRSLDKSLSYHVPDDDIQGLFFLTSREAHGIRRSIWAPAFSQDMMNKYHPVLENSIAQLIECIERRKDDRNVIDLGAALQHWSFDFNAHFVFGNHSIDSMMVHGDPQGLVSKGQLATVQYETLGEVPWLLNILWHLPLSKPMHVLNDYAREMIRKRKTLGTPELPDLCSFLLGEHDDSHANELTEGDLTADAVFAIQAGSDTTSAVLTYAFYHLLSNPTTYVKLQEELDAAFSSDELELSTLYSLPYLNAVVKEELRLSTPFGNMPRVVPDEGIVLDGKHIPGGTIVGSPTYAMQVAEKYWSPEPTKFRPERWLPGGLGPGSITEENALVSFQFGPFGCLGKQYAIRELLLVNAHLVRAYNMTFAPGFDAGEFARKVQNSKTTIFTKNFEVKLERRM